MHAHDHGPLQNDVHAAFKWALALNAGYVLVEAGAGFASGSLALLADAAHNLTDVAGLLMAWGAAVAAKHPANGHFTYGYGRATILAALVNALVIMLGVGAVVWEAFHRFFQPVDVPAGFVMGVAAIGIVVNAGTALLFRASRHDDLNAEGAFLHMMADAVVSLGVVLGGFVVYLTGWEQVDPLVAIGVSLVVAVATYRLLKSSFLLTLDGVPASVDREAIKAWLEKQAGVEAVHDLHIWALSTTKNALTAHLIMPQGTSNEGFLKELTDELKAHFNIHHTTFQIEPSLSDCCLCGDHDQQKGRKTMMKIQILGTGCPKCKALTEAAEQAAQELGAPYEIEKVTDIEKIMSYGVMSTPALVVDGAVKVAGKIPSADALKQLLASDAK